MDKPPSYDLIVSPNHSNRMWGGERKKEENVELLLVKNPET